MMTLIPKEQTEQKIEIISAVMLAAIIVAIAWCAYQSTLWNGIQTFKLRDVNSNSLKFVLKSLVTVIYSSEKGNPPLPRTDLVY